MFLLRNPTADDVHHFLSALKGKLLNYDPVGLTRDAAWWHRHRRRLKGFQLDHDSITLGEGKSAFLAARESLANWDMFPAPFASLFWPSVRIETGNLVLSGFQLGRVWSLNPCRIVYTIDERLNVNDTQLHRYGFGYGTLPGHVERGEEQFLVTWDTSTNEVVYQISSYSRSANLLAWGGYPFVRLMQHRFRRLSCAAMKQAVEGQSHAVAHRANFGQVFTTA